MTPTDRDVVCAIRRGDREAFAELVERYHVRVYGLALMMVRERAAAEEVAQDAFVRAYTHVDRFDDRQPFYPWLATIAVRLAQNCLRRRGQMMRREGAPLDHDVEDPAAPEEALAALIADERGRRLIDWPAWATAAGAIAAGLAIIRSIPADEAAIDVASLDLGRLASGLVRMPATVTGAIALAAGLLLYVGGLFARLDGGKRADG